MEKEQLYPKLEAEKKADSILPFIEIVATAFKHGHYLETVLPKNINARWLKTYDETLGSEEILKGVYIPLQYMLQMKSKGFRVVVAAVTGYELDTPESTALKIGAFTEVMHNSSLIIDDIEDNSVKRRGQDCCHIKFGVPVAVSAGNTMYFLAMKWILETPDPALRARMLEDVVREFTNLHLGQNQDIVWNQGVMGPEYNYTEEGYFVLCKHKTAGLLRIVCCLCAANSPQEVTKERLGQLMELYNGIGILFQVVDDILNLEPSEVASNKAMPGEDIREGNKTLITIHAMKHGSSADSSRLKEILNLKSQSPAIIQEGINICKRTGSIDYAKSVAQAMARDLSTQTEKCLKKPRARDIVLLLIDYILTRQH